MRKVVQKKTVNKPTGQLVSGSANRTKPLTPKSRLAS